jgi:membrane-associated phospholipid phosphatase
MGGRQAGTWQQAQRMRHHPSNYRKVTCMNRPAPLPLATHRSTGWRADLVERFWRYLALKLVGISAFMWLFFQGYFHTLRNPVYPVLEMPLTPLDALIPFQPQALVAYLSLWLYVGIAPGLLLTLRELIVYGLWAAALCLLGLAIFYFWPTAVPPRTVDVSGIPGFAMLHGVDAAGNACPSLHVATAMFTALWVQRLMRIVRAPAAFRWANGLWFAAIAWSTVAIQQHVVLDALAGAALGAAFAFVSFRWSAGVGHRQGA